MQHTKCGNGASEEEMKDYTLYQHRGVKAEEIRPCSMHGSPVNLNRLSKFPMRVHETGRYTSNTCHGKLLTNRNWPDTICVIWVGWPEQIAPAGFTIESCSLRSSDSCAACSIRCINCNFSFLEYKREMGVVSSRGSLSVCMPTCV